MKNPKFAEGNMYHVYNRGVEKRNIYGDEGDYFRFVQNLFEFNDENQAINVYYRKSYEVEPHKIEERRPRKLLVEMLSFCLMPNHFHLLLRQTSERGITEFMRKIGTGYSMYFNQKYKRVGPLFQGVFKAKAVENDTHFLHLPYYIHANPLDLKMPEWREKKISNYESAINFLENYRWSSFPDYIGKKNFPSVTQRSYLLKFFGGTQQYKKDMDNWLKNMNLESVKTIAFC